jgi:hypothetical protein
MVSKSLIEKSQERLQSGPCQFALCRRYSIDRHVVACAQSGGGFKGQYRIAKGQGPR